MDDVVLAVAKRRPHYETPHSRSREERIAKLVAGLRSWHPAMTAQYARHDVEFFDSASLTRLVRVSEIKARNNRFGRFSTIFVSTNKIDWLRSLAETRQCSASLIYAHTDCIAEHVLGTEQTPYRKDIGGRRGRNDPRDIGDITHIDIYDWEVLINAPAVR